MVPAQTMMDIDQDFKLPNSINVATDGEKENILETSDGLGSRCMDVREESINGTNTLLDEKGKAPKDPENAEVDIVTLARTNETRSTEAEDPDATEYSSSFADTTSDTEKCSGLSEGEVESQFFGDSDLASPYDAFDSIFQTRKKKLTNHWRSFIRPLMWRCKWTELKIKEIESQALKYAKELEACGQRKHSEIYKSTFEGFCSKSLPFSSESYRRKAIKRRKRKRVEDTTDTTAYMTDHSLFSYLENKKSNPEGTSMVDDFDNAAITDHHAECNNKSGIDNDQLFYDFGDGENSLEQVLRKIEIVHSRVHKLKNQLDIVISKNASKFSSSENLSLLAACDAQTSSAPSPTFSAGNGETISVGAIYHATQNISGYDIGDIGDLVMPENVMSSYGEAVHVPDIIESTVGLLSAADVTFHQPQIGDSSEDIVDNLTIKNEAADGEPHNCPPLTEKHHEPEKGEEGESTNPCPIPKSETDPMDKDMVSQGQSALKSCLGSDFQIPKNKRKRAERKAGSGGWSKKSGEPDSQ